MVDHDHQRIEAIGWGKINDEINQELFEGEGEGWGGWMDDNFVLLEYSAPRDKFEDKN